MNTKHNEITCNKCGFVNPGGKIYCLKCMRYFSASVEITPQPTPVIPIVPPYPSLIDTGFRCPFCSSSNGYYVKSQMSNVGAAVLILLLLIFCLPLFWIGFFIRESHQFCLNCNMKLSWNAKFEFL